VNRPALAVLAAAALAAGTLLGHPLGLGLSVVTVAVFAAAMVATPRRDPWSIAWWLGAAALAAVASLRAAEWVVWPCLVAATALASLAATGGVGWRQVAVGLVRIARLPTGALPVLRAPLTVSPHSGWRHPLRAAAIGVLLLSVFVPLFARADPAFAHILDAVVPLEAVDRPITRAAIWLAVVVLGGALMQAGRDGPARAGGPGRQLLARIEWALPLTALVVVFGAFVALQVAALYGGHDYVLRTAGLTYAEYAREGFVQLIVAAALTLLVIAGAARWARDQRLLRALLAMLCALTLVILASALTRLSVYEEAYGFTPARLVADAVILWLGVVFVLVLIAGAVGRGRWLPRVVVALSAAGMLAFAVSDPDRRIADHNVDRFERTGRIDTTVLVTLSPDAAPALMRLPPRLKACTTSWMRLELAAPDGLAGLNAGRARARRALHGMAVPAQAGCRG
jgi:Domain of unknown function (DUF4173)